MSFGVRRALMADLEQAETPNEAKLYEVWLRASVERLQTSLRLPGLSGPSKGVYPLAAGVADKPLKGHGTCCGFPLDSGRIY